MDLKNFFAVIKPKKYNVNSVIKYFMYKGKFIFAKSNLRIISALIAGTATNPTNFKIIFASTTSKKFFFPKKKPKKQSKNAPDWEIFGNGKRNKQEDNGNAENSDDSASEDEFDVALKCKAQRKAQRSKRSKHSDDEDSD